MKARLYVALVALLVAGLGYGAFALLFVEVEREERTPPRGRAAVDPYYALELVLRELGYDVIAAGSEPPALREVDAVFWFAPEPPPWELGDRVFEGGVVVVEERFEHRWSDLTDGAAHSRPGGGLDVASDEGSGGSLVLIPRADHFSSARLVTPGRADALAEVLARVEPGGAVWIVRRVERAHLLARIFGDGLPAVIALLSLLALSAARSALRFGPVLSPLRPGRRSFLEHLRAAGHFARRQGGEEALLGAARRETLARFFRLRPELGELDGGALVERLLEQVALDRATLRRALVESPRGDARAFVQIMGALEELRRTA